MAGLRAVAAKLSKERIRAEAVALVRTTVDPGLMADALSGSVRELAARPDVDFAARQELLEISDPRTRLERLRDLLNMPR